VNGIFEFVTCVVLSVVTLGQVESLVVDERGVVGMVVVGDPLLVLIVVDGPPAVVLEVVVVDVDTPIVSEMLVIIGLRPSPQEFMKSSVLISQTIAPPSPLSST
jgi:hypothetical protein